MFVFEAVSGSKRHPAAPEPSISAGIGEQRLARDHRLPAASTCTSTELPAEGGKVAADSDVRLEIVSVFSLNIIERHLFNSASFVFFIQHNI